MQISNYLDILGIISCCRIDPFTLIDLELPTNSYMIVCTDTQGFEEEEKCASTISVEHTLGSDMISFGYDLILLCYRVQELSVLLVAVLINFSVKKQVPKISFKGFEEGENCASTSSVEHTLGSDMEFIGMI